MNVHEVKSYDIKDVFDTYETTITWADGNCSVIRTEKNTTANISNPIDTLRRVLAKSR